MVNMEFIARETGLSRYTVSRALEGNPKVRPETIKRVLEACDKYGYIRNSQAVGLVKGRSTLVGAVVPYITDDFYGEFIAVLDRVSRERGFQLVYRSSYNDSGIEREIIRNFLEIKVCAMIVVPVVVEPDQKIHELARKHVPVVYFDRPRDEESYCVINDNRRGVREMTALLLERGRRPAYLGSFYGPANVTALERLNGYREAMAAAGLPPVEVDPANSSERQDNERFGYDNVKALLARQAPPDALVCVTDAVALGAMRALTEKGVVPGRDVLVAGHDNLHFGEFITPSLTTVGQARDKFAVACLDLIGSCLDGTPPEEKRFVFPPEIILRESTGF